MSSDPYSYRQILKQTWPIILASASAPLLGLVDTAIMGHSGDTTAFAALAIASLVFSFLYWSFGFLRMSVTGLIAQLHGHGRDAHEKMFLVFVRGLILAFMIAALLIVLQTLIFHFSVKALAPPSGIVPFFSEYFYIRIFAAPATLLTYVISGVLIALGRSRTLLLIHVVLNVTNAVLDVLLAVQFDLGIQGIAMGTAIAEYFTLVLALIIIGKYEFVTSCMRNGREKWPRILRSLWQNKEILAVLSLNRDLFIRTLLLLVSFAWFTHVSGALGETVLAANHILLQFVSFSAFFLDGFAHTLESIAGRALGLRAKRDFFTVLKRTSILAMLAASILASFVLILGGNIIAVLSDIEGVTLVASEFAPYAALYIFLAFAAFQLDGLFIAASDGVAMRNASILASLTFFSSWWLLSDLGNQGLWLAFMIYVLARAAFLLAYFPRLLRRGFSEA